MLEIRERLEQPDALIQEKKLIEELKKEQHGDALAITNSDISEELAFEKFIALF